MVTDWRNLPAGRELDRLIAERLGWHIRESDRALLNPRGGIMRLDCPSFETTFNSMWRTGMFGYPSMSDAVGLKLLPSPPHIVIISRAENGRWLVTVDTVSSRLKDIWEGEGDTLAMACCHAFLDHEERKERAG